MRKRNIFCLILLLSAILLILFACSRTTGTESAATRSPGPSPTPMYTEETWPYAFEKDEIHIGVLDWGWYATEEMLREMKEIGIDFFVGGMNPEMLDACQAAGIYAIPAEYNLPVMSPESVYTKNTYSEVLEQLNTHPAAVGEYLADQVHTEHFTDLRELLDLYREKRPDSMPFLTVPALYMRHLEERCGAKTYQEYLDRFLDEHPVEYCPRAQ